MKQTLIACAMMEHEINKLYEELSCQMPVIWIDRGYHNTPEKLKSKLQSLIDELQDQDQILLTFGLCGNGTAGLTSPGATLVLPRFDDCINMLLCSGQRKQRGLVDAGSIYLTEGWTQDTEGILEKYDQYIEEYGQEDADAIIEMMYEHYKTIAVIDTGCEDLTVTMNYAEKAAELLGLTTEVVEGSTRILRQLLTGEWDENFIVLKPGEALAASCWEFPSAGGDGDCPSSVRLENNDSQEEEHDN